ncbi:alkaline ceramidase 3-like, partial [Saccoglossus kowalevskii]
YAEGSKTLLVAGTCCYLLGFILWNVDNHFCDHIRKMRHQAITPFKPITQIHAWWHVLAGLGTMMQLMYSIDIRCTFLKYKSSIQTYLGFWPYLKVDTKDV